VRGALLAVPRWLRRTLAAILALALLLFAASFFWDEPMRRNMEARMNRSLKGY